MAAWIFGFLAASVAWLGVEGLGFWGRFQVGRAQNRTPLGPREPSRLWWLWWGKAVAGLFGGGILFHHPLLGLVGAGAFPWGVASFLGWFRDRDRRRLEASAWVFFHGLLGLLRAGVSLPSALFRLSSVLDSPFARRLSLGLETFERGRPLSACLSRVQAGLGPGPAALCLGVLGSGFDRGLPLVPFLERVLPWLEGENQGRVRAEGALRQALAQAGLASSLPWGVAFLMAGPVGHWPEGAGWAALAAIALHGMGLWVVIRVARFE